MRWMCQTVGVPRAGYYRFLKREERVYRDMNLRDQIQRIAIEMRSYGSPRITAEVSKRTNSRINHKRVERIMREDNLLCVRRRKFVRTTDSNHQLPIYQNLTRGLELTGVDQLWVSDITYIRLHSEFVYLAVILDRFSRRVIGWELGRSLAVELALSALRMALAARRVKPGMIHHSDRGSQYASNEYTGLLKEHGILISMSGRGNPYDNAAAESFIKTLKYEEVYQDEYRNLAHARAQIGNFLEKVYNQKRLHSALGYRSPAEFERATQTISCSA